MVDDRGCPSLLLPRDATGGQRHGPLSPTNVVGRRTWDWEAYWPHHDAGDPVSHGINFLLVPEG